MSDTEERARINTVLTTLAAEMDSQAHWCAKECTEHPAGSIEACLWRGQVTAYRSAAILIRQRAADLAALS